MDGLQYMFRCKISIACVHLALFLCSSCIVCTISVRRCTAYRLLLGVLSQVLVVSLPTDLRQPIASFHGKDIVAFGSSQVHRPWDRFKVDDDTYQAAAVWRCDGLHTRLNVRLPNNSWYQYDDKDGYAEHQGAVYNIRDKHAALVAFVRIAK